MGNYENIVHNDYGQYFHNYPLRFTGIPECLGALVAQWVKRWPTDLADRARSLLKAKSS